MAWNARVVARAGTFELDVALEGGHEPVALVGPNGSGKTTLLRALVGAVRPVAGEIVVGGRTLWREDGIDVPVDARGVGYVPQGYGLFRHLDATENVAFGLSVGSRRLPAAERRRAACAMLERLGCGELIDRDVRALSGGEQQKVALARALVLEPAMLLLDEPLAALDVAARRTVRQSLAARLREFGRPALVVTHDVRDVVALRAHVYVLEHGRIVQHGTVDDLRAKPATAYVEELVDGFAS